MVYRLKPVSDMVVKFTKKYTRSYRPTTMLKDVLQRLCTRIHPQRSYEKWLSYGSHLISEDGIIVSVQLCRILDIEASCQPEFERIDYFSKKAIDRFDFYEIIVTSPRERRRQQGCLTAQVRVRRNVGRWMRLRLWV